ncbi:DNA-binding helix-turn-helix protein [Fructobacillus ficulneus]|uniref:DNA-binding helix-turn-helix protein n=2 Tax=Fructobacillus ficulneus TaxID=157463 RepID=A0A0K8MI34_9LACO|nr:DNA-binding helix-turn-helix protein [Fructobacillus ficulneus]
MNRIKELRQQSGLSLAKLSNQLKQNYNLKISAPSLMRYENNETEPKLDTWQKMADFFKVPIPFLQGITASKDTFEDFTSKHPNRTTFYPYDFDVANAFINDGILTLTLDEVLERNDKLNKKASDLIIHLAKKVEEGYYSQSEVSVIRALIAALNYSKSNKNEDFISNLSSLINLLISDNTKSQQNKENIARLVDKTIASKNDEADISKNK